MTDTKPTREINSPWLTPAEAGRYLRLSPRTLIRHVACGTLCAHRIGHSTRYHIDDLDAFMVRGATTGPGAA